jgi:hypothetical protein
MIITREKEDGQVIAKAEFPATILHKAEEVMHQVVYTEQESKRFKKGIIVYILFCLSFFVSVAFQLDVPVCYGINSSIIAALTQPSSKTTNFKDITVEEEYWDWLSSLVSKLYDPLYYPGYAVPVNKRFALSSANKFASALRLT